MFCPNCRNNVVDGAEFCANCGTNLKQAQSQVQPPVQNEQPMYNQQSNNYQQHINNQNKGNNKKSIFLSIFIVIVILIIGVFGASKIMKKSNNTGPVESNTNLTNDKNYAFLMVIEDVFTITNRGTAVTGKIERGTIKVNDEVQIIGLNRKIITTTITGVEVLKKTSGYAEAGDNVSIILKDISREDVQRGYKLVKINSIRGAT